MKRHTGFTLIELIVTMAVAAILITLAVPNFRDFLLNNRLTGTANEFIAAANLARSEAIKRGRNATLCVSNNSMDANPTCTGGTNWGLGWLAWVEADGSGALNGDGRLRVGDTLANTGVTFTGGVSSFQYDSRGAVDNTDTLNVCDERTGETGRQITMTATGRVEIDRAFACP
ncbi:MAG: GspH/FimT family pseudopilin [Gammaproteobacteria bacterium]|nr:GspH/FimT family pseudopilin [Gammaproteobacteria bacterium]